MIFLKLQIKQRLLEEVLQENTITGFQFQNITFNSVTVCYLFICNCFCMFLSENCLYAKFVSV